MSPMRPKATKSTQSAPPTVVVLLSFDKKMEGGEKISMYYCCGKVVQAHIVRRPMRGRGSKPLIFVVDLSTSVLSCITINQ